MQNVFKKIYTLSGSAFSYAFYNIVYIKKNFKTEEGKYAIVNIDTQLKDDDLCRYFYIICIYLREAGFKVIIKTHWRDFKTFKKPFDFKRLLLKQNFIFVSNCSAPVNTIVLVQPDTANHSIHLSYGYNIIRSGTSDCIANYPMYPAQYKFYSDPAFSPTLKLKRSIKVFFAGDLKDIKYGREQIRKYFDVIPRLEVINFILSNFEKSRRLKNESGKLLLNRWLNSSDDYINEVIISEVKTKEDDWSKILSKTDFFICPPGVRIPWSHNCVEAMAAGAVPILEYGDLFYPNLENMKNCLSYTNYEELQTAIEKALEMKQSEIDVLRNNVLNYYKDYLSMESIVKKIKSFGSSSQHELKVAVPFIPTKEEWRAQIGLYNPRFLKEIGLLNLHTGNSTKH